MVCAKAWVLSAQLWVRASKDVGMTTRPVRAWPLVSHLRHEVPRHYSVAYMDKWTAN